MFKNKFFEELFNTAEAMESCDRVSDEAGFFGDRETEIAYYHSARRLERKLRKLRSQWEKQEEEYPLVYSC